MTNNDIYIEARKRYPHRWSGDVENDNNFEVFCEGAEWAQEQIIEKAWGWIIDWAFENASHEVYDNLLSDVADFNKSMKGE